MNNSGSNHIRSAVQRPKAQINEPQLDYELLFSDLDRAVIEDIKRGDEKRGHSPILFSVVSWGCAATDWLAMTLNSHPDIFCMHCANMAWQKFGGAPPLDGWKYLRVVSTSGRGYKACGDVHGISRDQIADLREKLGRSFNCAIVVREPLPRLRSQLALFEESAFRVAWNVDYVQQFIDAGVRLPEDNILNRLFLHGVNMLNSVIQEDTVASIWRSEDLTSDPARLTEFIEELTGGNVEVEAEWASRAVRRPRSNVHGASADAPRPFEPWQMEAIKGVVDPAAWSIYERLGYSRPDFV